jgi:hypothetical protein
MRRRSHLSLIAAILCAISAASQVNLQTGSANFSLPVFNWDDSKSNLSTGIAISYTSGSGLRVNDVASNIGQGWNLIAGGVITRLQQGEPDDQYPRTGGVADISKYPPGILYATVDAFAGCPTSLTQYPIFGWQGQLYSQHNVIAEDKQLDYFSFQFNGKAGMFVLDPTHIGTALSLGDSKMKITFLEDANLVNEGIRTRITSFKIEDVDGLVYKFTKHGLTKVLEAQYCDESLGYRTYQPKFKNDEVYFQTGFELASIVNPYIVGSWYLTEIEDALTNRTVSFNYSVTRDINDIAGRDIMYNAEKDYTIIFHKRSIAQTPALTSIDFPDGHTVTLNYGEDRIDLKGDKVLSSIDVTYQSRYLSRHEFNTTYIMLNRYGTPVTDYQKQVARLYLRSIRKIGPDLKEDTPPYLFDYYTGSSAVDDFVPPPYFYAKDIFGYFNGDSSMGNWEETIPLNSSINSLSNNQLKGLCFKREDRPGVAILNAKSGYAKNGLLRQIIYPTGGTLTYTYAQNTGVIGSTTTKVGGVHVSQTSSTDGGYSNGCDNPITTNYSYVLENGTSSSTWGIESPVNSMFTENHYQPEYKVYKYNLSCFPLGCCDWKFKYPGILFQQQSINVTDLQHLGQMISTVMGVMNVVSTIKNVLSALTGEGTLISLIIDVIGSLVGIVLSCTGTQDNDSETTMLYNVDLKSVNPLPAQFKRVEVTESSGAIGKTVQEFTSDADYALWATTNTYYSAKQRYAPWAYGLPLRTTVYDVNNNKIKESYNYYDYTYEKSILNYCSSGGHSMPCNTSGLQTDLVSCKCLVVKSTSLRATTWSDPNQTSYQLDSDGDLKVEFYGMYTGRTLLTYSSEKTFKVGDESNYLETTTNFSYLDGTATNGYDLSTTYTTQSNGDQIIKQFTYSGGHNTGILETLVDYNIKSLPVSSITRISKYGGGGGVLNELVTEYTQLSNGEIKPYRTLEQRFSSPKPITGSQAFSAYQGPSDPDIATKYKVTQNLTYDATGNLLGIKDEADRIVTNLYGYEDKFIVASVINATPVTDKCAYASFEATSEYGEWEMQNESMTISFSSSAITGSQALDISSGLSLSADLNTAKAYIVSLWATSSSVSVSNATLIKTGPTYNGFTYYEYEIPSSTSSVTVTGNTTIDELRLYPKTARMRTINYDLLFGKTSECDENNRITYYEYDKLGRLRFIKDESKNIVKMYEYNNVSAAKQNGCPTTYYNKMISEIFVKDNCSTGYFGSEVVYTVAANTYSSTISQLDADAQAELNILTNGQNYANTNGSCNTVYYNTAQSQNFTTENCPVGYIGGTVAYTVPAGRYYSLDSQAAANQLALDEIAANGQFYANHPDHQVCTADTVSIWESEENAPWYCLSIGGSLPPHMFVLVTSINPNSSTYLQTQWIDVGISDNCPSGNYYNALQSQNFTRNNCGSGYDGSTVAYTVPAGTYSSTTSQAAADQLALDEIAANGQSYANSNGTCTLTGCNTTNCDATGEEKKCVGGVCESGIRVNTYSYYNGTYWVCVYHYEWSDYSWSDNYYEYNSEPCAVD